MWIKRYYNSVQWNPRLMSEMRSVVCIEITADWVKQITLSNAANGAFHHKWQVELKGTYWCSSEGQSWVIQHVSPFNVQLPSSCYSYRSTTNTRSGFLKLHLRWTLITTCQSFQSFLIRKCVCLQVQQLSEIYLERTQLLREQNTSEDKEQMEIISVITTGWLILEYWCTHYVWATCNGSFAYH